MYALAWKTRGAGSLGSFASSSAKYAAAEGKPPPYSVSSPAALVLLQNGAARRRTSARHAEPLHHLLRDRAERPRGGRGRLGDDDGAPAVGQIRHVGLERDLTEEGHV